MAAVPDLATLKTIVLRASKSAQPTRPVVNSPGGGMAVPLDTVGPTGDQRQKVIVADPADMTAQAAGHGPPDWLRSPDRVAKLMRARASYQRGGTLLTGGDWTE